MIELSIIIVSFNTKYLLKECLSSLSAEVSTEIIVVDNNSNDGSSDMVNELFPKAVLIKNKENRGFGAANNQGIKKARGEYVLLLNSDTVLLENALKNALSKIKEMKNVGVLGIKLLNTDKSIQQSVGFFPTPIRILNWMFFIDDVPVLKDFIKPYHVALRSFYNKEHEVDWVTGAFFLSKKEILVNNMFDEKMFMYVEEIDLCYRIKKRGWRILFSPVSSVIHKKGGSGSGQTAGLIEEFKGIKYFYKKHYSLLPQILVNVLLKAGALLRIFIFGIIRPNHEKKEIYRKYLAMAG